MDAKTLVSPCGIVCQSCRHLDNGCSGCREGGGDPDCVMRLCSERQCVEGCWECAAFPCAFLMEMDRTWRGINIGMLRAIRKVGPERFVSLVLDHVGPRSEYGDLRYLGSGEIMALVLDGQRPEHR